MLIITPDLLTYIEGIDIQHMNLIDCLNVFEAIEMIPDMEEKKSKIENAFDFLSSYISEHFGYEEQLMKKNNYPNYRGHKELHQRYIFEVDRLKTKYDKNGINSALTQSIDEMTSNWSRHIETSDKTLGLYILCKRQYAQYAYHK